MPNISELDKEYIMGSYGRYPVSIERGEGAVLYNDAGEKYIDFASGIGTSSVGHSNPVWIASVTAQLQKISHTSNYFSHGVGASLAKRLCEASGLDKVFFANSGAEANECAIKTARKYSFDKYGRGRSTILTLQKSFHGRTVTTLSATGQDVFHNYFFPFTGDFRYIPANNIAALKNAATDDICAIMLEIIQGEGGVNPLEQEYLTAVTTLCKERDILLVLDEVQTGIGRTGKMFAFEYFGLTPDIVTLAKGLAGGLPIGAAVAGEKCALTLSAGTHGSTFGGNPVSCAGAHAVLDIVDNEEFLAEVVKKGEYLREKILSFNSPYVTEIRGRGLMLGIAVTGKTPRELALEMLGKGVICLTAGADAVRLLPPLTISYAEMDKGLEKMRAVLV